VVAWIVVAMLGLTRVAWAQATSATFGELRADVIAGRGTAAQVGVGGGLPLGYYVRASLLGAGGPTWRDGKVVASGRVDVLARFLLDPFREMRWGLSFGGGVSVPVVSERRSRPYLTVVTDIEGPRRGGYSPAIQLGLGGGARVGLILRSSAGRHR
jgi:hypothetical protein